MFLLTLQVLREWEMYVVMCLFLLVDIIVLTVWQIMDPLYRELETFAPEKPKDTEKDIELLPQLEHCSSKYLNVWLGKKSRFNTFEVYPHHAEIIWENMKCISAFSLISQLWDGAGNWDLYAWKTRSNLSLSCIFSVMITDHLLTTQRTRAPSQYKDRLIYVWRFPC